MSKVLRFLRRALVVLSVLLWLTWTALTLLFANLQPEALRQGLAAAYVVWLAVAAFGLPAARRRPAVLLSGALVNLLYLVQLPSNDRAWAPELAVAATADIQGDRVVVHGVRNFHYRTEQDFDVLWEDRTYDLSKLRTLDLMMSYWGPVDYCHTLLSFGFEGGEHLAVSVEARKERGEEFSTFGGLFKMFELSYIFADESDVIGLRTTQRREDVYLYRLRAEPERLRALFLAYLTFANDLAREPEYYGVLENSCGVNILHRIDDIGLAHWVGTEALLNGYWDMHLYASGAIHQGLPFEDLRALSLINERGREAQGAADFSARIRAGLPTAPSHLPDPAGAEAAAGATPAEEPAR